MGRDRSQYQSVVAVRLLSPVQVVHDGVVGFQGGLLRLEDVLHLDLACLLACAAQMDESKLGVRTS